MIRRPAYGFPGPDKPEVDHETIARLPRHGRTGRPLGDPAFIARFESRLHRRLRNRPPRPKPKPPRR
jgi:hypothetical protein